MNDYTFVPFDTWASVLDAVNAGYTIYYHAPLDYRPAVVQVVRRRDGLLRVTPVFTDTDPFTCGADHLTRFRKRVVQRA